MKVLIVGANFSNKGAQSMLFITVDEIKKRCQEATIFVASNDARDFSEFQFNSIYSNRIIKRAIISNRYGFIKFKECIRDTIKYIIGKRNNLWRFDELKDVLPTIDLILDISGFSLGDKWSIPIHENYLDNIRLAKRYKIPMIILPQSFGPFDYSEDRKFLLDEIKELLSYPRCIFAREYEGYRLLKEEIGIDNVYLSSDLVLQNKSIELANVFKSVPNNNIPVIDSRNAVAIIPNSQCFAHGDKEIMYNLYDKIIDLLLSMNKKVYLFRHSSEDRVICENIANRNNKVGVELLDRDFDCFEYNEFIKQFNFAICSRYHGLVNAYRNVIPCISLGWAIKYERLMNLLGQERFSFNMIDTELDIDSVLKAIEELNCSLEETKRIIRDKLNSIQEANCFDCISNCFDKEER